MKTYIESTYEVDNIKQARKIERFFKENPDIALPAQMMERVIDAYNQDPYGSRAMVAEIQNSPGNAIKYAGRILKILTGYDLSLTDIITGTWKRKVPQK